MPTFKKVTNECNMPSWGLASNIAAVSARKARDARKKNGHTSKPRKTNPFQNESTAPEDGQRAPEDELPPPKSQQPPPEAEQRTPKPAQSGTSSRKPRAHNVHLPAENFHSSSTSRPIHNDKPNKLTAKNLKEQTEAVGQEQTRIPKD